MKNDLTRTKHVANTCFKLNGQKDFSCAHLKAWWTKRGLLHCVDCPVVGNFFADCDRIARMIGATRESFSRQWMAAESNPFKPVEISNGPVRGVIQTGEEVDLYSLPLAQHFFDDAGPYISSGIAVARDPDTGVYYLLRAPEG